MVNLAKLKKTIIEIQELTHGLPAFLRYGIAVFSVIASTIILFLMNKDAAPHVSVFLCSVILSTWLGGVRPGLLAVVFSALSLNFFFLTPRYSFAIEATQIPRLLLFLVPALFIVWLSNIQRNVTGSLRHALNVLDETVQKLSQTNTALHEEIAERKKSELIIIREKELSNEIIDSIPGVFMVLDENLRIIRWNKNVELVSGYTTQEIPLLHAINDFYNDADDRKMVESLMEEAFEKGTVHAEASPHTKGGRRIFFSFNARLINYEGKRCIICTAIDISERRSAEEELKREKEILMKVFDNIPVMIGFVGEDGGVKLVNPEWERTIGWTVKELQEQNVDIFAEAYPDLLYRHKILDFIAASTGEWVDLKIKVRDGRMIDAACAIVQLSDGTKVAIAQDITERKQAEDALRQSEDRIRLIIDTIPIMAWSFSPDGIVDFANQRWLDYAEEGAIEDSNRIIHPEDLGGAIENWLAHKTTGKSYEDEMRLRGADGEYRWFLVRTAPLYDEQGKILKWYGVSIDIEDSKRAEDELRLAYQRLSYHVENSPLAVIELDKDLFIKRWSNRAEEIFGWKASEALGKNVYDPDFPIIYIEDIPAVDKINEQLSKGTVDRNLSHNRNYTKNGNVIYSEWYNSILRDEYGKVITILSLVHDITQKKIAEEQIKQSETHLAEAQRLAKLGSWDFDIKTGRLTWSEELYNVFGADEQTFRETHGSFLHLVDEEDREFVLQTSRHTQQTGEPFTIEYHITTSTGEKRVIQEHGYGERDNNGQVIRLFGTAQDITERKKTEETLQQSYEEIRRLTGHLQNIREEERISIAREIHDELGQQLTVLKMEMKGLNKKLKESDEGIKPKIAEILDLLDSMVKSVRRISSELRPSLLYNLGLAAAIEWHLKEFEKRSGTKTVFNELIGDLEMPDSVKNGLFRIFQESLTNISRHANADKINVTLEQKDQQLVLNIEDDGQGFEKEEISSKRTLGILGMKERAQVMEGNYEINSIPGKGTVVTVAVPYNGN